jgi:hypothetical protein
MGLAIKRLELRGGGCAKEEEMETGSGVSGSAARIAGAAGRVGNDLEITGRQNAAAGGTSDTGIADGLAENVERLPMGIRSCLIDNRGLYDARRLRSQREIIRDVMLAAADCDTWLTLGELRGVTRYGEASISAQLRHLRKMENGGYDVLKRHREGASPAHAGSDGRGECVWEYLIARGGDLKEMDVAVEAGAVG